MILHNILLYYIISYYIIQYHFILYCITSWDIVLYFILNSHIISYKKEVLSYPFDDPDPDKVTALSASATVESKDLQQLIKPYNALKFNLAHWRFKDIV